MRRLRDRLHRAKADDEGLALALALIFVLVVSLTVTALLPYTQAGLKTSTAVRETRTLQLATDGAVDEAMGAIRGSLNLGAQPCSSGSPGVYDKVKDYANPAPDTGVTKVQVLYCNTSSPGSVQGQPPYALQTLQSGITIDGNAPFIVAGGVLADGDVTAKGSQQSINIQGDLYATGACTVKNLLYVSGQNHCANTTPAYAAATDPDPTIDPLSGLAEPASLPTTVDPIGTCRTTGPNASSSVVVFSPGLYTQTPLPDPTTCSGPNHTTWWFQPGSYYFDFPDKTFRSAQYGDFSNLDAGFRAANVTVVGGTPLNWDPNSTSSTDVANLSKLNADHSKPACDEGQPGVLFQFGGPTNIGVGVSGAPDQLELCSADIGSGGNRLSLFGLRNGTSRSTTPTSATGQPGTAASTTLTPPFLLPAQGRNIDGTPSTAALAKGTAEQATLDLGSFSGEAVSIPDGSVITSARLRVNYWTTATPPSDTVAARVAPSLTYKSDAYPSTKVSLADVTSQPTQDGGQYVDLPLTGTAPRWQTLKADLVNLAVTFAADGSALHSGDVATTSLDGVQLEVGYIPPAIETTRCPAGGTDPCNIVTNTVDNALFLHGTVYAPKATLEAAVHNYSTTVFERGVIVAAAVIHVSASVKQTLPPFQLPKGPTDRLIRFTAQAWENGAWRTRLVALVRYDDYINRPGGKTSASPGHRMTVTRWTVVR